MKFRIHYEKDGEEKSFCIKADTIEEIRLKTFAEMKERKIDEDINNCWSEEIR